MKRIAVILTLIALAPLSATAFAHGNSSALEFDQDATPDVIFGTGNENGGFTTDRRNGVEVALRVKRRFPAPMEEYFSNGNGTYSPPIGDACPGYGFAPFPLCLATPFWSFDWSVNVNFDESTSKHISDYTYELGMDADPSRRTKFTRFDPITPTLPDPASDHEFGDNSSMDSGMQATDVASYLMLLDTKNVAQNSWNYEFFNEQGTSLTAFDPSVDGNYIIYLRVLKKKGWGKRRIVAQSVIQVLVGNGQPVRYVRLPWPRR